LVLLENIAADDRPVNAYDEDEPVNDPVELGGRGILFGVVKSFVDDDDIFLCCDVSCRTGTGGMIAVSVLWWLVVALCGATMESVL
jgi:hypothetical protein